MPKFPTFALLALLPMAACSGTADGGDGGGDDKGGSGAAGAAGTGQGGAQGGAQQGGAGPVGGTSPSGGAGAMGGTSPSGGASGTPSGGTAGAATGGVSGTGMTGGAAGNPAGAGGTSAGMSGTGGAAGAAAGAAGKGGAAGSGGTPVNCPAPPADTLVGWATQGGMTTGGGNGSPVTITSVSGSNVTDNTARVLQFTGTLSGTVNLGSNKTLQGMGATATINGKINIDGQSNIILRNFRLNAGSSSDDGITIQDSDHIWINHLEIYDAEDGNMDITNGSDYITVSWTKFRYSATGDHNFSNLIGSDDSDSGSYRITFHHNWWANNVDERMPRVRFGQVHLFNNLYGIGSGSMINDHCIRAAYRANVKAESNYFDIVRTPHEIAEDSSNMAILEATTCANNTSVGSTAGCNIEYLSLNNGGNPASRGTAFMPPYSYTSSMTVADCVKAHVSNASTGAGPH
jgi:pectate lyase